jgi:hypothetical protein
MRTTLDIDDRLLEAARRLARRPATDSPYRLEWKTHRGRTLAGVDVSDRDRLYERMEGRS